MTETQVASMDQASQDIVELVRSIAAALVENPSQIRVESQAAGAELVIHLSVPPDDLGVLLGKQGRTARSLRTIVIAAASKLQVRCVVDICSDE